MTGRTLAFAAISMAFVAGMLVNSRRPRLLNRQGRESVHRGSENGPRAEVRAPQGRESGVPRGQAVAVSLVESPNVFANFFAIASQTA